MLAYLQVEDVAKRSAHQHQSIIHLMLVGGGGDRCWTSWATCIADFELAGARLPKISKGGLRPGATPRGYAATRAARACGRCAASPDVVDTTTWY